jgi:hypothetical protein
MMIQPPSEDLIPPVCDLHELRVLQTLANVSHLSRFSLDGSINSSPVAYFWILLGFEETDHKFMHVFVYLLSRVELFRFASLLMESIQYPNLDPMFVRHKESWSNE